jgi:putative ABC transport system substrate-binding protein
MKLRTIGFLSILVLVLLNASSPAKAQQGSKVPRIGYLSFRARPIATDEAFVQGLRDLGWVDGQNITIEYRWGAGKREQYPILAKELVHLNADLIVATVGATIRAAKDATTTIPIVMTAANNAVERGFVASLAQPGGNITGMSAQYSEVNTKLLELLHETLPKVTEVGLLAGEPASPIWRGFHSTAPKLRLTVQALGWGNDPKELQRQLDEVAQRRPGALVVSGTTYSRFGRQIGEFAAKHRMPLFSANLPRVEKHFGFVGYGPDWADMYRRAATFVDKILKGANPANLPVERATKFTLVVNMKTAKELGITIPPSIRYRANRVIE